MFEPRERVPDKPNHVSSVMAGLIPAIHKRGKSLGDPPKLVMAGLVPAIPKTGTVTS